MKRIVPLGKNRYIHLDSYGESVKSQRLESFVVAIFILVISAITVGALFGSDITKGSSVRIPFVKTVTGY
jgi:hypothetical protein